MKTFYGFQKVQSYYAVVFAENFFIKRLCCVILNLPSIISCKICSGSYFVLSEHHFPVERVCLPTNLTRRVGAKIEFAQRW